MAKAAERSEPEANPVATSYGIPLFLDQLIETLELEKTVLRMNGQNGQKISGPAGGPSKNSELGKSASKHGREMSDRGFTLEQVVHDYGDLCQAVTDMAYQLKVEIQAEEFRTLNRCLDNGIADAVTEFSNQRRLINDDREEQSLNRRLGSLVHDLRIHINAATYALSVIKSGKVGYSGATGSILDRSLAGMRSIVDRSLADARLVAGLPVNHELIAITGFMANVKDSASLEARSMGCELEVSVVGLGLAVEVDQDLLFSAVGNLLQNAFKFTKHGTKVSLTAYAEGERILIDVHDHCGGLPPGDVEVLFEPFKKFGTDKSGVGLGLAICRRSVEANNGVLSVRDIPGSGCVFSISLPKHSLN